MSQVSDARNCPLPVVARSRRARKDAAVVACPSSCAAPCVHGLRAIRRRGRAATWYSERVSFFAFVLRLFGTQLVYGPRAGSRRRATSGTMARRARSRFLWAAVAAVRQRCAPAGDARVAGTGLDSGVRTVRRSRYAVRSKQNLRRSTLLVRRTRRYAKAARRVGGRAETAVAVYRARLRV